MSLSVAIIGASHKPQRYSYKVQKMLMDYHHTVFPVSGNGREILGVEGFSSIRDINGRSIPLRSILTLRGMSRSGAIFWPADPAELFLTRAPSQAALMQAYQDEGIETLEACTLVMISTGQFDSQDLH